MSQRSIEVKVGALILVALGLLGAFVVVMGGLSFEPTFTVYVAFNNPGGLQTGAPIRISGVKIGRVGDLEFRGGQIDPKTKQPEALIRAVAKIEKRYQKSIHENSRWFVTSQGVLGELFLAVEPGSLDRPLLSDGATVSGISPPRLDLLLSESYELLHRAYLGITENEDKIKEMFEGLHKTLRASGDLLTKNEQKLNQIVDNVESLTSHADQTIVAARERFIEGPQITRIMNNVERTTNSINENLDPMLTDGRKVLSDAQKLTGVLAAEEQLGRYGRIIKNLDEVTGQAKGIATDAQTLVTHMKSGKGTIGALVMDEAVYDDLQEMLRDLKHNPWKLFWKN